VTSRKPKPTCQCVPTGHDGHIDSLPAEACHGLREDSIARSDHDGAEPGGDLLVLKDTKQLEVSTVGAGAKKVADAWPLPADGEEGTVVASHDDVIAGSDDLVVGLPTGCDLGASRQG
jgi:hypothetical protein